MKKQSKIPKRLRDYAKPHALPLAYQRLVNRYAYFVNNPHRITDKEFVRAFNSRKTSNTARYLLFVSSMLNDKEFVPRKLRSKQQSAVGISPVWGKNRELSHFEIVGLKKGRQDWERIRTDKGLAWRVLTSRIPPTQHAFLMEMMKYPETAEINVMLLYHCVECKKHLENLQWTLATFIKLSDRRAVIIYSPASHHAESTYDEFLGKIDLHNYPDHIEFYLERDKKFMPLYMFMQLLEHDQQMVAAVTEVLNKARSIDGLEFPYEEEANAEVDELIVLTAKGIREVDKLLAQLVRHIKVIPIFAKQQGAKDFLRSFPVVKAGRHRKNYDLREGSTFITVPREELITNIFQGLEKWEQENE